MSLKNNLESLLLRLDFKDSKADQVQTVKQIKHHWISTSARILKLVLLLLFCFAGQWTTGLWIRTLLLFLNTEKASISFHLHGNIYFQMSTSHDF